MLKLLSPLLFILVGFNLMAQNKTTIKGIVADSSSKVPVEFATVAIVSAKDTSLIFYTLTDKNGIFKRSGISIFQTSIYPCKC